MAEGFGGQTMVGRLRRALVKPPRETPQDVEAWREYGYLWRPDPEATRREFEAFVDLLRGEGVEVIPARGAQPGRLDSIFIADPGVLTDRGAVIGRMGKELRRGEEAALAREFQRLDIPILRRVRAPATLEGGDVLWLDPDTVVVGRSYRTDDLGFLQFREAVTPAVGSCIQVHLPHWRGPSELLHLTSIISPVDVDLAVVHRPLLPIPLAEMLQQRGFRLVEVPEEEMRTKGCNVLALAPRRGIMVEGNPRTQGALEAEGVEVLTYPGQELSVNRCGGPTCLTRPLLREV